MIKNKNSVVCIIPARSGSKRIKNKNIINFFGKPLIYYSIKNALNSKLFNDVIVTTDCVNIKKISEKYGAKVPFLRPRKLSNDKTSTKDVVDYVLQKIDNTKYDYFCVIYPTSPLLKKKDLLKAFKKLSMVKKANGIFSIAKFQSNPLRAIKIKNNFIMFNSQKYQNKNSNKLTHFYFDAGNFYFFKTKEYIKSKNFINPKMLGYLMPNDRAVDINDKEDLSLAKKLFKFL